MVAIEVGRRQPACCCRSGGLPGRRSARLLVADAHIGKAVSFRRLGVPVPRGTTTRDPGSGSSEPIDAPPARAAWSSSATCCTRRAPTRRRRWRRSARWRERHAGARLDAGARQPRRPRRRSAGGARRARCVDEPLRAGRPWRCATTRAARPGAYVLAGHLHPCVTLSAARTTVCACRVSTSVPRSACCRPSARSPACTPCGAAPGDRVFVVADDAVHAAAARPTLRA